jgi:hypothetical protein
MQRSNIEPARIEPPARALRACCLRWAQDHMPGLKKALPKLPVNGRAGDNWRPLVDTHAPPTAKQAHQPTARTSPPGRIASEGETPAAAIRRARRQSAPNSRRNGGGSEADLVCNRLVLRDARARCIAQAWSPSGTALGWRYYTSLTRLKRPDCANRSRGEPLRACARESHHHSGHSRPHRR